MATELVKGLEHKTQHLKGAGDALLWKELLGLTLNELLLITARRKITAQQPAGSTGTFGFELQSKAQEASNSRTERLTRGG